MSTEEEAMADGGPIPMVLLPFDLWKSPLKLPSLDPEEYVGLLTRQSAARQAWHVEMEKQHVGFFLQLIEKLRNSTCYKISGGTCTDIGSGRL